MDLEVFFNTLMQLRPPWRVERVELTEGKSSTTVDVRIGCVESALVALCPECGNACSIIAIREIRAWRHLDLWRTPTMVHAELPVVNCPEHGKRSVRPPWDGNPTSGATAALEQEFAEMADAVGGKKATVLLGLEGDTSITPSFLRKRAKVAKKAKKKAEDVTSEGHAIEARRAHQLSIFAQNDLSFVNEGLRALKNLQLEEARESFYKHRKAYPKGSDVRAWEALTELLIQKFAEAPADPASRAAHLHRAWNTVDELTDSREGSHQSRAILDELKKNFFLKIIQDMDKNGLTNVTVLPGGVPTGCVFLQAGLFERAIQSIQDRIPETPHDAALYGFLGDAYHMAGKVETARQCYREGCIIDPLGMDWKLIKDEALRELKEDIAGIYGFDEDAVISWLPSHARIEGLFSPKVVRLNAGLEEIVQVHLSAQKKLLKEDSPRLRARLFFTGIILCDSEESLRFIKKIHLAEVRKSMQQANPALFSEYMDAISSVTKE
ncbi:MAG: transposase family protein [Syntrophobacteraceae bacterium]